MKKIIKNISYTNQKTPKSDFDLISLENILERNPNDHNQFDNHRISFYVIILITKEKGIHTIDYNDYQYKEGTIFTIRKDSIHKFQKNKAQGKVIVFTENFIVNYLDELQSSKVFQLFNELLGYPKLQLIKDDFLEIEQLIYQIEQEYKERTDIHSLEIIRSLLHVLITKLFRQKSKGKNAFKNKKYLLQFIAFQKLVERDCFKNKKVAYYAKLMNVTPRTLNNITQSILQRPAKSFINEIMIIQIKRLLINSPLTINQIAYKVGFYETSNLFKYFKKHTGVSPNSFRIQNR